MTIQLLEPRRFGGIARPAYAVLDVSPDIEAELVATAAARWYPVAGDAQVNNSHERDVLFGDSMTSQYWVDTTPTASYDPSTGVLTCTQSSHGLATGWEVDIFNRSYAALKKHKRFAVTYVDANTFTVAIGPNLVGVPSGALSGTTFARVPTRRGSNGWVNWLQMASGWALNVVYNGAQSGDTTGDCLARIREHCLDHRPTRVWMQMPGINDMSAGNGPIQEDAIAANQLAIIDAILGAEGKPKLYLLTMTPVASGEGRGTLQNMMRVVRLNRRLADLARRRRNVVLLDAYRYVVDPTDTTGYALADAVKTGDKIHYSIRKARAVADMVWAEVGPDLQRAPDTLPTSTADCWTRSAVTLTSPTRSAHWVTATATAHGFRTGDVVKAQGGSGEVLNALVQLVCPDANTIKFRSDGADGTIAGTVKIGRNNNVFDNPLLLTNTGGVLGAGTSGTVADGLKAVSNGAMTSVVASVPTSQAQGFGYTQQVVCTPSGADGYGGLESEVTSTYNNFVAEGRRYRFEAWLELENLANVPLSEIMVRLMVNAGGVLYSVYAINTFDSDSLNTNWSGQVRTPDLVIPAGAITQFYFQVYGKFSASSANALTLKLSRIAVRELDLA